MSVIGSNIIAGASGTVETGYQISRSLRFNRPDSANLSRTFTAAPTVRTKQTISLWVKRSSFGALQIPFAGYDGSSAQSSSIYFTSGDTFGVDIGGAATNSLVTTQVFRDPSAFMHMLVSIDTTQATASNRVKIYANGQQITAFGTSNYPAQNATTQFLLNNANNRVGSAFNNTAYFDGYLTDVYVIDGQALTPSDFGETDANTGVWVPKAYTGTYGTNGFWLKFDDNSGVTATTLGKDSSGNGNNWTPNNFSVTAGVGNDSLVDSPTNYGTDTGAGGEVRGNYATWNPLAKDDGTTLTNGNLDLSSTNYGNNTATFFLTSGKWYWEGQGTGYVGAICGNSGINWSTSISNAGSNAIGWWEGGPVYWDGGNNGGSTTFTSTDVVGVALDMNAGVVYFYKNGTLVYTITFGSGTVPNLSAGVFPCFNNGISSGTTKSVSTNFGQRPFAYTAPSGFKALCTQNLP